MSLTFKSTRKTDYQDINGVGTYTVSIDFVPNVIEVVFVGNQSIISPTPDTLTWDLVTTAIGYDLTVNYNTGSTRKVKSVLAKMAKNPEQTISFGT